MKRSNDQINQSRNKLTFETIENPLNLLNMPIEILEEIINKLPFREFGRIRGTCIQFRNAADNILIRKLMHNIRMFDKMPFNIEYQRSKIVHQLTWPYIRSGYRSAVATLLLSVTNIQDSEYPLPELRPFMGRYLYNFCQCIDCQLGDLKTHVPRLLYCEIILGFLNKLTNTDRTEKQINSHKLELCYTVNGAWFGLLGPRNFRNTLVYPDDRNYIILFLADAMASNISELGLRNKWHSKGSNRNIVYGIEDDGTTDESVLFELTIKGSNKVVEFLRTAPRIGVWDELPIDNFIVTINIICFTSKKHHKLGCPAHTICSMKI